MSCGYSSCIKGLADAPTELVRCLIILFTSSVAYSALGVYFYEVIPQQYGIRKSPLFCLKNFFNSKRKFGEPSILLGNVLIIFRRIRSGNEQ